MFDWIAKLDYQEKNNKEESATWDWNWLSFKYMYAELDSNCVAFSLHHFQLVYGSYN